MDLQQIFNNFFAISFQTLNLLSFVLGMTYGLISYTWNPWRTWMKVVIYFVGVAVYYAIMFYIASNK